jgi:RNA polymerase sigma factor (sigma-70 family)
VNARSTIHSISIKEKSHEEQANSNLPLRSRLRVRSNLPVSHKPLNSSQPARRQEKPFSCPDSLLMNEPVTASLLDLRRQFLGFLERRLIDRSLAEDILQSAYVRALESSGQLRQDESAVAWFYRILRNALIDHHRRRTTESLALDRWARELETETTADPLLKDTACQCIAGALDALPAAYASLLREVDLAENTLAHYAASEAISAGNAAVRAHRARTALRKQLIQCCGTCATHGCLDCQCAATRHQYENP